jgi:hypothetical protein
MAITFKNLERELPFNLYQKIVLLKVEKERKADPIAFVMNGKTKLTTYRHFHIFDHIAYQNINMTPIKSFFNLYEQHKECKKVLDLARRSLCQRLYKNGRFRKSHYLWQMNELFSNWLLCMRIWNCLYRYNRGEKTSINTSSSTKKCKRLCLQSIYVVLCDSGLTCRSRM